MLFEIVELMPFYKVRDELFTDEQYRSFQLYLAQNPYAGVVIPDTGGCRKIRWQAEGKGKRGGSRVIYFLQMSQCKIILVLAYGKNEKDDVPRAWLRRLKEEYDEQGS